MARSIRLLVIAAATAFSAGSVQAQTPVMLQMQSKSWLADSSFDRDRFTTLCEDAGVRLVPPRTPDAAATAVVSYTETKGPGFSMFGVGEPVGFGTNISFRLNLLDAKGKTVVAVTADAETPPGQTKEQFHAAARAAFAATPGYARSCSVVAAALGAREQLVKLLPWALIEKQGVTLLTTLGFRPQNDTERAYFAIARRDFGSLRALGPAAVEPLLLLFQNSLAPRDGIGLLPAMEPQNVPVLERALDALVPTAEGEIDERIADVLATFLNDYSEYRTDVEGADVARPILIGVIRVLGRVGDVFAIPLLEEWQKSHPAIALEVTKSLEALRKRLVLE